jgi:hypothetical protein
MASSTSFRFQLRGDTSSDWATSDAILADREPGLETDTLLMKVGDGVTPWSGLSYFISDGTGGGGGVGGATNLAVTRTTTTMTVTSDTGTDAVLVAADSNAGLMTAAMKTKLDGIATSATANDTDANLKNRSNHTGTQASSTISDLTETVQDMVAAMLTEGTGIDLTYNDTSGALTIAATGGGGGGLDAESVRDTIGTAMVGTGLITVTVSDGADTITVSTTATANSSDATLLARANHTGTQSADTLTDGTTNKAFLATERTKLAGIAPGAQTNTGEFAGRVVGTRVDAGSDSMWETNFTGTMDTTDRNIAEHKHNGLARAGLNEWGAFRVWYAPYNDAAFRAVREDTSLEGSGGTGPCFHINDRRSGAPHLTSYARMWNGGLVRNGITMTDCYVTTEADPTDDANYANLPVGTVIIVQGA